MQCTRPEEHLIFSEACTCRFPSIQSNSAQPATASLKGPEAHGQRGSHLQVRLHPLEHGPLLRLAKAVRPEEGFCGGTSGEWGVGSWEWGVGSGGRRGEAQVGRTAAAHLQEESPGGASPEPLNASQKSTRMSAQRGEPIAERQPCIGVPAAWCDKDASQWKAHLCCTPARAAGPDRRSSTGCRPAAAAAWQTAPCGRGGQAEGPEHALSRRRMGRFGAAVQPTAAKSRLPLASREQTLVAAAA